MRSNAMIAAVAGYAAGAAAQFGNTTTAAAPPPGTTPVPPTGTAAPGVPYPNPFQVGNYQYRGCIGSTTGHQTFRLVNSSPIQDIPRCITLCAGKKFVGLFGNDCYCADTNPDYPANAVSNNRCNIQCGGRPTERCGGNAPAGPLGLRDVEARQAPNNVLLTVYELVIGGTTIIPTTITATVTNSLGMITTQTSVVTKTYCPACEDKRRYRENDCGLCRDNDWECRKSCKVYRKYQCDDSCDKESCRTCKADWCKICRHDDWECKERCTPRRTYECDTCADSEKERCFKDYCSNCEDWECKQKCQPKKKYGCDKCADNERDSCYEDYCRDCDDWECKEKCRTTKKGDNKKVYKNKKFTCDAKKDIEECKSCFEEYCKCEHDDWECKERCGQSDKKDHGKDGKDGKDTKGDKDNKGHGKEGDYSKDGKDGKDTKGEMGHEGKDDDYSKGMGHEGGMGDDGKKGKNDRVVVSAGESATAGFGTMLLSFVMGVGFFL